MNIYDAKYDNELTYPKVRKQKFPEPITSEYDSYAEWGIEMDAWKRDIIKYDVERPHLLNAYNLEHQRLNDLFMYDLLDEFGWIRLSDSKQMAISAHIWEDGDGNRYDMYDVAICMSDMIDELVKS